MLSTSRRISCDAISLTYNWNRQQKNVKRQKLKLWWLHIRLVIFQLVLCVKYTLSFRSTKIQSKHSLWIQYKKVLLKFETNIAPLFFSFHYIEISSNEYSVNQLYYLDSNRSSNSLFVRGIR